MIRNGKTFPMLAGAAAFLLSILSPIAVSADDGAILKANNGVEASYQNTQSASIENGNFKANAGNDFNANASASQEISFGKNGLGYDANAGVTVENTTSGSVQYGSDDYNVHASGEVKISAEMAAKIKAQLQADQNGIRAGAEGGVGASVSAGGTVKGGATVWGIPIDVVLTGAVKAGAEASGKAGVQYDAKTGKVTMVLEASAVLGVGAQGGVAVELGVGEAFKKVLETAAKLKDSPLGQNVVDTVQDMIQSALSAEDGIKVAEILEEINKSVESGAKAVSQQLLDKLVNSLPEGPGREAARAVAQKIMASGIDGISVDDVIGIGSGAVQGSIEKLLAENGISKDEAAAIAKQAVTDIKQLASNGVSGLLPSATKLATTISNKIGQIVYSTIERNLGKDAADKWEQVWNDIKAGNDPWASGTLKDALKETAVVLVDKAIDKLGDMAWKRIEQLAKKYPAVATAIQALGISKDGIINAAKNIWGVLTGPGTLADKFKALAMMSMEGLAKMAKNFLNWVGGKFAAWISSMVTKWAKKIWAKIEKWLQKLFGDKINYDKIFAKLSGKLQQLIVKGIGSIVAPIAEKVEYVITNTADRIIYGTHP